MVGAGKSALLVVDMQEDFCPPNGQLAVDGARDLASPINELLSMPFAKKIATKDFHPPDHISFEDSHPPGIKAFQSMVQVTNPWDASKTQQIPVWPSHCVQGTKGAELIPELDISKIDHVVEKGRDKRVEMFSAFADGFGNKTDAASEDLARLLHGFDITQVFVVGVAGDFCVNHTARDAKKEGFDVFLIEDAVKSVDPGTKGWIAAKDSLRNEGIKFSTMHGREIAELRKSNPD